MGSAGWVGGAGGSRRSRTLEVRGSCRAMFLRKKGKVCGLET
jgi:hypothetical protein